MWEEEENARQLASILQPKVPHHRSSAEWNVEEEEEEEDTVLLSWSRSYGY